MGVPCVAGLPTKLEVDAFRFADCTQALENHGRTVDAELGLVKFGLIDADLRRVWVEVVGFPDYLECVAGIRRRELGDGSREFSVANIAPGTDSVCVEDSVSILVSCDKICRILVDRGNTRHDVDGEFCHFDDSLP